MAKNLILGTILPRSAQIWAPKIFFLNFTSTSSYTSYAICRKANEQNFAKNGKNLISGPVMACLTHTWAPKIFFVSFTSTSSWPKFDPKKFVSYFTSTSS